MDQNKCSSGGRQNTSSDACDDDEQEESSSSKQQNQNVNDELVNFREKWKNELKTSSKYNNNLNIQKKLNADEEDPNNDDYEKRARILFQTGIELEKTGKLYEAIQFYRRAVQIVPDIEFRLDTVNKKNVNLESQISNTSENDVLEKSDHSNSDTSDDEEDFKDGDLLLRIKKKLSKSSSLLCTPKYEQKATHISSLPFEIILLILRWLVSADLDVRSLEMFSTVCRGFYVCARDTEIWHLACLRVWSINCGTTLSEYNSWRNMFIERARVNFHGCYISKTTYIRHGENSFQDQFYRPWHLVTYYRYFRFFPEGLVLMLTSSDEPAQCVNQMKYRNCRTPILSGYYRLKDDKIVVVIQRQETKMVQNLKKNNKKDAMNDSAEQTFNMELQIRNHRKRRHVQLVWTHYSVFTRNKRGDESTCTFDLVTNRFPPLWFSRVKSFSSESDAVLK